MKFLIRWVLRIFPRPFLIRMSYLFMGMLRPFLKGNAVECPVCGSTFSRFLPYGVRSRSNVLCPSCLSLERHRLIWLYLQETGLTSRPARMLHVAPEQCFHKRFRKNPLLDYVTADLESPLADYHFDLHRIPFDDNSFDLILCNHVLEHVADDRAVLSEIFRVLKAGGRAILQVPLDPALRTTYENPEITDPRDRERHFGQKDHVRLYGIDYPDRLRSAGFLVEEVPVSTRFSEKLVNRYRLAPGEILYIAGKS